MRSFGRKSDVEETKRVEANRKNYVLVSSAVSSTEQERCCTTCRDVQNGLTAGNTRRLKLKKLSAYNSGSKPSLTQLAGMSGVYLKGIRPQISQMEAASTLTRDEVQQLLQLKQRVQIAERLLAVYASAA